MSSLEQEYHIAIVFMSMSTVLEYLSPCDNVVFLDGFAYRYGHPNMGNPYFCVRRTRVLDK